ncbi:extracellular solute-binding protein [Elioraea sp. Yellowstone]|jgi:multiple sugar transport system substrate-binding protein|uniref:ABC transporter substrate-binding protein n=1 Tax=Elioraea sp. Yellowstone TaxID=2592070 RepID=UPI001150C2C3|nr:extracellular solute-binding protein [Elioraea sp. Yellowstone]TQF81288.1 extracellular solute-binding protein [Elioraea sp. Yellowstone]
MTLDRRTLIRGTALAAAFAGSAARAQPHKLSIYAHRVHRTVATSGQGGDITAGWSQRTGIAVEWVTFDTGPLQERLFREASLSETSVDIGFLLNTQTVPRITTLFEPLDEYMARDPVEDPDDIFPGMIRGMTIAGRLYGLPFRHASSGFHYNEEILAERGITSPPKTIEELADVAKRCTYTRANGTPVVGFLLPGVTYPNVIDIARAWDGEFITPDMRCVANEPPMVKAITLLRELFVAGAFPRNFAALGTEDVNVWMQTGRAAMIINSMGRNQIYNDPQRSQFPGRIRTTTIPVSRELAGKFEVAPAKVEFWGMAIPRNARNKPQAWSLMKEMLSREATLKAALNGNGPVRNSTYDDPRIRARVPFAEAERAVLKVARVPMPAFDQAARAADLFKEEAEAAVLGMKTPQQAMDDLVRRVRPLLG